MNELTIIESLPCVAGGLERIKMAKETAKNLVEELRGEEYSDSVIRDFLDDREALLHYGITDKEVIEEAYAIIEKPEMMDYTDAVFEYGEEAIKDLDCQEVHISAYQGGDEYIDFEAKTEINWHTVVAHYQQKEEDVMLIEELDMLDWFATHYTTED